MGSTAYRRRHGRVVIFDRTARPAILPLAWRLGGVLHRGRSYGVRSWNEAIGALLAHPRDVRELQFWCHGKPGGPLINGSRPSGSELRRLARALPFVDLVWFRACSIAQNPATVEGLVSALGCPVAAHTQIVSAPNPLRQRGLVLLEPGEAAAWPRDFDGAAVSTLRMRLPYARARRWNQEERHATDPGAYRRGRSRDPNGRRGDPDV